MKISVKADLSGALRKIAIAKDHDMHDVRRARAAIEACRGTPPTIRSRFCKSDPAAGCCGPVFRTITGSKHLKSEIFIRSVSEATLGQ